MSISLIKMNVTLPQLLCFVVVVAVNAEYRRFEGFAVAFHRRQPLIVSSRRVLLLYLIKYMYILPSIPI